MLTDYCPGGELFFHLKKLKSFPEPMMKFYAAQISMALDYLHVKGIIYRDLKPENILLDRDGNCKLTDFGLSKIIGGGRGNDGCEASSLDTVKFSVVANTFCGTPEYLSPEMLIHRQRGTGYGYEVDFWALGVVCFELLTGWPPFFDRDFGRMCEKILSRPLRFPAKFKFTPAGQSFVKALLHREPGRRLGGGVRGFQAIKEHAFFADINFDAMERRLHIPPFVPSADDSRNFEKFTKMPAAESPPGGGSRIIGDGGNSISQSGTTAGRGFAEGKEQIIVPTCLFSDFEFFDENDSTALDCCSASSR